jgi:hypothetical protein
MRCTAHVLFTLLTYAPFFADMVMYVSQRGGRAAYKWGGRVRPDWGRGGSSLAEFHPYMGGPEHTLFGTPKKAI